MKKVLSGILAMLTLFTNVCYADMSLDAMEKVTERAAKMPQIYCYAFIAIIFTIIVELLIAWLMKFKHYKLVIFTNLVTQIFLQIVTIILYSDPFISLSSFIFIVEIIIMIMEYKIYANKIEDISKKKIFLYTFVANLITYALPLFIGYYTERIV